MGKIFFTYTYDSYGCILTMTKHVKYDKYDKLIPPLSELTRSYLNIE